ASNGEGPASTARPTSSHQAAGQPSDGLERRAANHPPQRRSARIVDTYGWTILSPGRRLLKLPAGGPAFGLAASTACRLGPQAWAIENSVSPFTTTWIRLPECTWFATGPVGAGSVLPHSALRSRMASASLAR